jgi:maltose alpha-D-glucosyltransferase / alpha-amylase
VDVVADIKVEPKLESDELWFKDAIIYQLHVKAFADSNNDGIGDFAGLTEKLDYLKDVGVTALWLLPFYSSPGRDDGYDISDYRTINPDFGTMADFRRFMQEAKRRKLRVLTELVINHTSDRSAPEQTPYRVRDRGHVVLLTSLPAQPRDRHEARLRHP